MLLGYSSVTVVQPYSKAYTSQQAALAHLDLSRSPNWLRQRATRGDEPSSDVTPRPAPMPIGPKPSHRDCAAGRILVARFRSEQDTCQIIERDGRLGDVLPSGDTYMSRSGLAE